ncbi:hypothetical protein Tco_1104555 [Tanacetum coccineum]
MQTVTLLKNNFKKEESRNIDREISLEKKIKQLDNIVFKRDKSVKIVHMLMKPQFFYDHTNKQALCFQNPFYLKKAQQLEPKLYNGNVIKNTSAIVIPDFEETLMLAEESRSKIILKQQDPMMLEKKVNTTPVDYVNSVNSLDPTLSSRPIKVEVPKELPKVSLWTYKQLYDSILNNTEQGLTVTTLKDKLRKLKGKDLADNVVCKHNIDPEMLKIDVEYLNPRLLNNRSDQGLSRIAIPPGLGSDHSDYLKHTQEEAAILREIVEQGKLQNPLNESLYFAYKIQRTPSSTQKNKVEAHPRTVKSSLKNKNSAIEPKGTANVHHYKLNANSEALCVKCNGCMLSDNHDFVSSLLFLILSCVGMLRTKSKLKTNLLRKVQEKFGKPTGKVFTNIRYTWRPTGRTFTIVGNACPLNRITTTAEVPLRKPTALESDTPKLVVTLVYLRKPKKSKTNVPVIQIVLWNVTISRVYYVEGLGHNLFSVGQFYDLNLEVAFRHNTCFIRNLEGGDLLTGSRGKNLYTLSLRDMMASSPICLLLKASKTKSWLWH